MRTKDAIRLGCNVTIEVCDANGTPVQRIKEHNLVTLQTRNLIRDFLNVGTGTTGITHFAVGTGNVDTTPNDTMLGVEVHRAAVTKKMTDGGRLMVQQYLGTAEANGHVLTEAGLFNALAGGTLFARVKHAGINKTSSLTVTYNWVITIGAG